MNRNTFPPLISGTSVDFLGQRQFLGESVLDTMVIQKASNDLFFNPQNGLTGYAFDGSYYEGGKKDPVRLASWFTETPGATRGSLQTFPTRTLVLLSDASLSLLDISTNLSMWMIFARTDSGAFTNNFLQDINGYLPSKVSYTSGAILVTMVPDSGAANRNNVCLMIDFMRDVVYVDYQETNTSKQPSQQMGYLGSELEWLKRMTQVINNTEYGDIARHPASLAGFEASGTWKVYGHTPTPSPKPVYDTTLYGPTFTGDILGYLTYFDTGSYNNYFVALQEQVGGVWTTVDTSDVAVDGAWGPLTTATTNPRQVVCCVKGTTTPIGSSLTEAWDSNYEIKHYYRATTSDTATFVTSTPAYSNGLWDVSLVTADPRLGIWEAKLHRKADDSVIASCSYGDGLVRSWVVPQDNSNYDLLKNQCLIDDHATAVICASAYVDTDLDFFVRVIRALLRVQNQDGSWCKVHDVLTGMPIYPTFKTVGGTAACVYALLQTLKVYPGMDPALKGEVVEACHNGLAWCKGLLQGVGPFEGLYLEGHGRLDKTGFYLDMALPVAGTITQVMMAGTLKAAAAQIPIKNGVNQDYHLAFDSIMGAIEAKLWQGNLKRYAQSYSATGPVLKDDAFTREWTCLLALYTNNTDRFLTLFNSMWVDYRVEGVVSGFTPFSPTLGYTQTRVIWPALGLFLALLSTRGTTTESKWAKLCYEATEWRSFDGGWSSGRLYQNYDAMSTWDNTSCVCWAIMAQHDKLRTSIFI